MSMNYYCWLSSNGITGNAADRIGTRDREDGPDS
jgi:hypothetical protein